MKLHRLGNTGVMVSELCLGAMMFGEWGNPDHEDSIRIIHRALDAGINFIDTADVYSNGESETIVGKALAGGKRDDVVLATKVWGQMYDSSPNHRGTSRRWIIREVENSLRRLQTDYIDLYQIHRPEAGVDLEETLGALTDLVRAGKIRYIGSSTYPGSWLVEAQWKSSVGRFARYVTEQPPYSILARGIERDVLPTCDRYGIGVLSWSPLAGGWLSGRYTREAVAAGAVKSSREGRLPARFDLSKAENRAKLEVVLELGDLAASAGITMIELAIAFVLRHPVVTSAIIGPRTMEQLESQLTAVDVVLSEDVLDRIDQIVAPGVTLNSADAGYDDPGMSVAARRAPRQ